jgi:hypothetical protein
MIGTQDRNLMACFRVVVADTPPGAGEDPVAGLRLFPPHKKK